MKIEDYLKYRVQGGDIYVLPVDVFEEIFDELLNFQNENQKYKEVIKKVSTRLEYYLISNLKYESSQKEFIKLLDILKEVE